MVVGDSVIPVLDLLEDGLLLGQAHQLAPLGRDDGIVKRVPKVVNGVVVLTREGRKARGTGCEPHLRRGGVAVQLKRAADGRWGSV